MNILFFIAVMAFVALLWASISIAQYVRRARRRKRRAQEFSEMPMEIRRGALGLSYIPEAPSMTFTDPEAPVVIPEPVAVVKPEQVIDETENATSEPEQVVVQEEAPAEDAIEDEIRDEAFIIPVKAAEPEPEIAAAEQKKAESEGASVPEPEPELEITEAAEEDLEEHPEEEPTGAKEEGSLVTNATEKETVPPPPIPAPPPPRVFPHSNPKHPLAKLIPPIERPDWAFFNKDMGDLSDPAPRSGSRIRPAFNPDHHNE